MAFRVSGEVAAASAALRVAGPGGGAAGVAAFRAGIADGTMPPPVRAGEGLDLITGLVPAGQLVRQIGAQAEAALARLR